MKFNIIGEFYLWLRRHEMCILDSGSQGMCYRIGNKVYKIFLQYIDYEVDWVNSYSKDDIMQFSSVINNTYVFPTNVILVGDIVVGYIMDYVNAKSLYKINPFYVNLDKFQNSLENVVDDIRIISNNGILSFDVMYNILYGDNGFKVIDTLDYSKNDKNVLELYKINYERFIYEIRLFLIDGIFDKFISSDKMLNDMCYDKEANFVCFLKMFRDKLSENEGKEILKLMDARNSMNKSKTKNLKYIREFCDSFL